MLWETMKAYVRAQVISYNVGETREKTNGSQSINRVKVVDQLYSTSTLVSLYRERISLQTEFKGLSNCDLVDR